MNIEHIIDRVLSETTDSFTQFTATELGFKSQITQTERDLEIILRASFPCQMMQYSLLPQFTDAIKQIFPQYHLSITLNSVIQAHHTQLPGKGLRGVKNVIAIGSGKGGVGKSTVTVHLATCLANQGARVGILDADIYGPSIPTMLGHREPVQIKDDQYIPVTAHGIQAMSIGYLTDSDDALIWRGPMLAKALIQMLDLTRWDDLDYLFIDLPPGTGDIQLSLVQKIPLSGAVIITTPQTVATQDAQKALKMFEKMNINVLGIIENMAQHICTQCGHQETLFGQGGAEALCHAHQTVLLGKLPLDANITAQCDIGQPIPPHTQSASAKAFLKASLMTSVELAKRPLNYASKFPPIVVE